MKRFYDQKRGEDPGYKPGDKVYLSGKNLTTHRPMEKLDDKRHGPFKVVCKVGSPSYKLKLPDTWKVHPVFNTVFLKLWVPPVAEHQKAVPLPPPDVRGLVRGWGSAQWEPMVPKRGVHLVTLTPLGGC
jgi:hypothetical protein